MTIENQIEKLKTKISSRSGPIAGLILIAIGTGGIKSSVGVFGADQIPKANIKQLSRYFALFYFSINTGSFISTLITPILRSISTAKNFLSNQTHVQFFLGNVDCFGYDCYSLAFAVPSILMLIALGNHR